jgi:ribose 5-phosphate isomerase
MAVLRIEHPVADFESWRQAFEDDPIGRERMNVRRYTILRSLDDPGYVMVDLELDSQEDAEQLRSALRELWGVVQPMGLIGDQQARIAEVVDVREYR